MRKIQTKIDVYRQNYTCLKCKQNDDIELTITLLENGTSYLTNNKFIGLNWVKSDNTFVKIDSSKIIIINNVITIDLPRDCTRASGESRFELEITDNNSKQLSTFPLCIDVVGSVIGGTEASKNVVTIIEELNSTISIGTTLNNNLGNNIKIGQPLHLDLTKDITTGNQLKIDLDTRISTGTALKNDLTTKVTEGNTLKIDLTTNITEGNELKNALNSLATKQDNAEYAITTTNWGAIDPKTLEYTYILNHTLNSKKLHATTYENNKGVKLDYEMLDNSRIKFTSNSNANVSVILSSGYYGGYTSTKTETDITNIFNQLANLDCGTW